MNDALKNPKPLKPPMSKTESKILNELSSMEMHEVKTFSYVKGNKYEYFEVLRVLTGWIYTYRHANIFVPETRVVDLIG